MNELIVSPEQLSLNLKTQQPSDRALGRLSKDSAGA